VSVRKWDLAWALLDPTVGPEQAGRRPVLVFCNDDIASPIGLATVLPLTTWRRGRRVYPTEVLLPSGTGGLPAASLILAHQVRTISAGRLSPSIGSVGDAALREQVARALRLWLDLAAN
jgi:mRNA interferase MazF